MRQRTPRLLIGRSCDVCKYLVAYNISVILFLCFGRLRSADRAERHMLPLQAAQHAAQLSRTRRSFRRTSLASLSLIWSPFIFLSLPSFQAAQLVDGAAFSANVSQKGHNDVLCVRKQTHCAQSYCGKE